MRIRDPKGAFQLCLLCDISAWLPLEGFSVKFDTEGDVKDKSVKDIQTCLKSDKNIGY
jgi:hypothetical protein